MTEEWRSALVLVLIALAVTLLIALGWAMIAPR
jgi:Tfp pilus assembly protein PilO